MTTLAEIRLSIEQACDETTHNEWIGMTRADQNDMIIEIQRGEATVDNVVDTLRSWANESEHSMVTK